RGADAGRPHAGGGGGAPEADDRRIAPVGSGATACLRAASGPLSTSAPARPAGIQNVPAGRGRRSRKRRAMRATLERSHLLRSLGHAQRVVERRNTIPILSNVLVQGEAGTLVLK